MKILSYVERADKNLVVTTDNVDMPVFVYPIDKFKKLEDLKREINKKISLMNKQKTQEEAKRTTLKTELDTEVVKNAR